jgi:hypothetical protein
MRQFKRFDVDELARELESGAIDGSRLREGYPDGATVTLVARIDVRACHFHNRLAVRRRGGTWTMADDEGGPTTPGPPTPCYRSTLAPDTSWTRTPRSSTHSTSRRLPAVPLREPSDRVLLRVIGLDGPVQHSVGDTDGTPDSTSR